MNVHCYHFGTVSDELFGLGAWGGVRWGGGFKLALRDPQPSPSTSIMIKPYIFVRSVKRFIHESLQGNRLITDKIYNEAKIRT